MPFQQIFSKRVNDDMQDAGPSNSKTAEYPTDNKNLNPPMSEGKEHEAYYHSEDEEEIDMEKSEKGQPPRFSTLFTNPIPPRQEPQYPVFIETPIQRRNRRGVFVPLPLFVFLMAVLFLETTMLFAYMLIRSFGSNGGILGIGIERQPAVNISPNFIVGGAGDTETITTTVWREINTSILSDFLPGLPTTSQTLTTSSSSISPSSSSQIAAAVSNLLGVFNHPPSLSSTGPTSTTIITVTPTASIPTTVVLLTVDPEGSPITPHARSTVTSVYVPGLSSRSPEPTASNAVPASVSSAAAPASVNSGAAGVSSSAGGGATVDSNTPTPTTSSAKSKNTFPACFGGAGAVQLNCV